MLAFDIEDPGEFTVIAQFPNPTAATSHGSVGTLASGGTAVTLPFWANSGRGASPFAAVKNIELTTSRQLSLSHVDVVLISEKLARAGIGPVLEFFLRHPELRLISEVAVVQGDMRALLESEFPLEPNPGLGLLGMLEYVRNQQSQIPRGQLLDKLRIISFPGIDPAFIRVIVLQTPEAGQQAEQRSTDGTPIPKPALKVHGSAVFDDDKMVGWFDAAESLGVNWVLGHVSRAVLTVESPQGGLVSLELKQGGCGIRYTVSGNSITMTATIEVLARVQDVVKESVPGGHPAFDPEDTAVIQSIADRAAEAIRNDIEHAIAKAKQLGVDVFGFGNTIYRKEPQVWNEIVKGRWDEFFKALDVNIEVEVNLRRTGLTARSIIPR